MLIRKCIPNLNLKVGLVLLYFCHKIEKTKQYCIFGILLHERGVSSLLIYYMINMHVYHAATR